MSPMQRYCEHCGTITDHARNQREAEIEVTCVECCHVVGDAPGTTREYVGNGLPKCPTCGEPLGLGVCSTCLELMGA